jgi:cold shock protein
MERSSGVVKFYNIKSRFGFVRVDGSGDEIYVQSKDIIGVIEAGDRVNFDIIRKKKGPAAVLVEKIPSILTKS